MKKSAHAKRMMRHQRRLNSGSKLNLVSLMDIFTILVFFLMVNSSEVQVLQNNKSISLPESVAEKKPRENLVIMLNSSELLVQGRKVADLASIGASDEPYINALAEELKYQSSRRPSLTEVEKTRGRSITIMGDHSIPYSLLKKVMATCSSTDYRNISLAVSRQEVAASSAQEG